MSRPPNRRKPHPLLSRHGEFVCATGPIAKVVVETSERSEKIDHVWIDLRTGKNDLVRISLSTCSRQSRLAGFDPRVWIGTIPSTWIDLPFPGIQKSNPLNYAELEAANPIHYLPYDRAVLEKLLIEKAGRAVRAQAWGELYVRGHPGIHQIHSRRASFAVPLDRVGEDGALRFYYPDSQSEMLLFKFAGQP